MSPSDRTPRPYRPKVVPLVSRAPALAEYLHREGRDASPAEHRRVIAERWPHLTPDEMRDALDLLAEVRDREESIP